MTAHREQLHAELTHALLDGDAFAAEKTARSLLAGGLTLAELYDAVTEQLYLVGERWACGDIGVRDEHRATEAVLTLISRLRGAPPPSTRGSVVLALAPGERHDVGIRMLAHLLEHNRFAVTLAGELPWPELAAEAASHPSLVAVGVGQHALADPDRLRQDLAQLRAAIAGRVTIMLGGLAFTHHHTGGRLGADAVLTTAVEAVTLLSRRASPLTRRETQVLQAVADGLENTAIAELLGVRPSTVKAHLDGVYGKLAVSTRSAAVARGVRDGWIS